MNDIDEFWQVLYRLQEIFIFDLTPHVDSNPYGRIMATGSTPPPTEMSIRIIAWR